MNDLISVLIAFTIVQWVAIAFLISADDSKGGFIQTKQEAILWFIPFYMPLKVGIKNVLKWYRNLK